MLNLLSNIQIQKVVLNAKDLSSDDKIIYSYLVNICDIEGVSKASISSIHKNTGISYRNIDCSLFYLIKTRFLEIKSQDGEIITFVFLWTQIFEDASK